MRAAWALAFLTTTAVLSGCLSSDDGPPDLAMVADVPLDPTSIRIPNQAELLTDPAGAILQWTNVTFPFEETITLPEGASIIRLEGTLLEHADLRISTYLFHEDTGRRRCNPDRVDTAWNVGYAGHHMCSGMTAIDPPGSNWTVRVTGAQLVDPATGEPTITPPNLVRVVFEDAPADGVASRLDLTQLSMPTHDLLPTEGYFVPSFDGTDLWVEVTLPEGEGPWPTIISASPYNGQFNRLSHGGPPAMWEYWTHDWAKRGYAAINVDVRGFGLSDGCVEIWSENEQKDQAFIVDWVAAQDWSDGHVGFYGQSYVGTTPTAAAVYAPEALDAIITVAPVINAYEDWHHGGVPNAENTLSPVAYQVLTDSPSTNPDHLTAAGPLAVATGMAKGLCDPTIIAEANDPRAVYDAFYEERDFKPRAKAVKAAVLYTEGFEDANVKSSMIPGWFNQIDSPKLGIFGHWVHQHPTRADEEVLFLGWMDQYVKGKALGFEKLPNALIATNVDTERHADSWPTSGLATRAFWPDWASGTLGDNESAAKGATLTITPDAAGFADTPAGPNTLTVSHKVEEAFAITGTPHLQMRGTLETKGNAFLYATLYDVHDGQRDLVTYGAFNLAHDARHTTWAPVTGPKEVMLPFLPTEYVFQEGHELVIELSGALDPLSFPGIGMPVGQFEIGAHPNGVGAFHVDTVPLEHYGPLPRSAQE